MSNIIDLTKFRDGPADYIDHRAIEDICAVLQEEIGAIVIGSKRIYGEIDHLAYELNAHLNAIRRAMAVVVEMDGAGA